MATYTYDPSKIGGKGVDRMRFELGDTMVGGGSETCAMSDEEYASILASGKSWKKSKLSILGSIVMRFAYEVDTTVGPLKLELQERAKFWKKMYDDLKDECGADIMPTMGTPSPESYKDGGHYFYGGMHDNEAAGSAGGDRDLLPKAR